MESSGLKVAREYCVTDVWAVLPDRIVERATIIVEDGVIVSVVENGATTDRPIPGHGSVCIPGIVDIHSDVGIETSPTEHAITTQLHVLGFSGDATDTASQTLLCASPRPASTTATIDHRPLLWIDNPAMVDDVARCAGLCAAHGATVVVSVAASALTATCADDVDPALEWFTVQAMAQRLRLLVRGPVTADDIDRAVDWGAVAVEDPATIEAARRAHERGLAVIGSAVEVATTSAAPTAISPLALVELGLCDALSSASEPTSMLDAISIMVLRGICDLRTAVKLVTSAPAGIAGLTDRGRLVSGLRGDLVLLRPDRERFRVRGVLRASDPTAAPTTLVS